VTLGHIYSAALNPIPDPVPLSGDDIIRALLKERDFKGRTALHLATETGDLEVIQALLKQGADLESVYLGSTALGLAIQNSCTFDVVQALIQRGASLDTNIGKPLIFEGFTGSNGVEFAPLLRRSKPGIESVIPGGVNAINNVVRWQEPSTKVFRYLLELGVDPYVAADDGFCTIHYGLFAPNILWVILEQRLHLHPRFPILDLGDFLATNPHMIYRVATLPRIARVVGRETARSIFCDNPTRPRFTALCWFVYFLMHYHVDVLLDWGFDLEAEGSDQGTALMLAASKKLLDMVKILVRRGARISYMSGSGIARSAVKIARSNGFTEIVDWLIRGRFVDQKTLGDGSAAIVADEPPIIRPWSGTKVYPYPIPNFPSQKFYESSFGYAKRLAGERKIVRNFCRGKVMMELSADRMRELMGSN